MSFKRHFRRFLEADPGRLHVAAHSHHLWPDVTFAAQRRCWEDAARLADRKWELVFGEVIPETQAAVARVLGLADPKTLAFGPNTHGFLLRLLSCLPAGRAPRILTTDGEFHSFSRQIARLEEDGLVQVRRIACRPLTEFAARFAAAAAEGGHDLVYLSQVFYDSGFEVRDLAAIVEAVAEPETFVALDGYHGFMAVPSDLSGLEKRVFYLAGGYKYAMAGEGVCFLHAPPGYGARPRDTGWFAAFGALEDRSDGALPYGPRGARFLGATFDPVGLYRLRAVLAWLDEIGIGVADIHAHARGLQEEFIEALARLKLRALHARQLVVPPGEARRGNFLAFDTPQAGAIHRALLARRVVTDHRGTRLRIGFGLYHDSADVGRLCAALGAELA